MSQITKLEVQKNDETRANLYIDDKFFAGISIELCIKNQLKVGKEIDIENLQNMLLDDEKGVALNKAIKYIGSALKTEKQIKDYLRKKEYQSFTIDYVIDKLLEYKYLDDEAYAKSFVLTYSNKYGRLRLINLLKSKGVSQKVIDKTFDGELEIKNNIESVAEKYLRNKEKSRENLQKLSRFLYSRGYDFDDINSLINRIKE